MIQPTITLHLTCGQCIEINPKYIVDYRDRTDKNGNVIGSWLSTTNRELGDSREIKESSEEIKKIIDKHKTESALIYEALDTINCTLTDIKNIKKLAKLMKTAVVDSKNNECCDNIVCAGVIHACPYVDEDYGECSIFNEELKPVKKKIEYGNRYKRCQKCLDNFVVKTDI